MTGPADQTASAITDVELTGVADGGVFGGIAYERRWGFLHGAAALDEDVVGLAALPVGADGRVRWTSEFEVVVPAPGQPGNDVVLVEAENRGSPRSLARFNGTAATGAPSATPGAPAVGSGFLFRHHTSYGRVQWQTGLSAGVPATAQGLGLVIVRDFGRLMAGEFEVGAAAGLAPHRLRVLTGGSQSSWFVNTLIAEGFNEHPADGSGVFHGAVPELSAGNWLAINTMADDGQPQEPYVRPHASPLTPAAVLTRPASDPFLVDVASYTDFYRLRSSVFYGAPEVAGMRRYTVAAAHAPAGVIDDAVVFDAMGCNGGHRTPLNPLPASPYSRALLLGLLGHLGADLGDTSPPVLQPSATFVLGPEPEAGSQVNGLPGTELQFPVVDADGMPVGGIPLPDVALPLGRPSPVSLPPVGAGSITDTCGNFGGWQPFDRAEVRARYGDAARYRARYGELVEGLIATGWLLGDDRDGLLRFAERQFLAAP